MKTQTLKRMLGIVAAFAVMLAITGVVFTTSQADAQIKIDTGSAKLDIERKSDLKSDIATIINYGLGFAGLIAVIFLIYGGVMYIISGGEQDKIDTAKNTIIYAIVGIVVILLAFVIVSAVGSILK